MSKERIAEIRTLRAQLGDELYSLVAPTEGELKELEEDLQLNPDIYASYLIEGGEGDKYWIAENVYDEREAREANES